MVGARGRRVLGPMGEHPSGKSVAPAQRRRGGDVRVRRPGDAVEGAARAREAEHQSAGRGSQVCPSASWRTTSCRRGSANSREPSALSRLEPVTASAAFGTLVVERFLDGVVLLLFLVLPVLSPELSHRGRSVFRGGSCRAVGGKRGSRRGHGCARRHGDLAPVVSCGPRSGWHGCSRGPWSVPSSTA